MRAQLVCWGRAPGPHRCDRARRRDPAGAPPSGGAAHRPGAQSVHSVPLAPAGRSRRAAAEGALPSISAGGARFEIGRSRLQNATHVPRKMRSHTIRLRPRASHAVQGHATQPRPFYRSQPHHAPTARVGLHRTLATSRETIHPTRHASTRPPRPTLRTRPIGRDPKDWWEQTRPPPSETQSHALPRTPSLSLSWARRRPAAPEKPANL